MVSKMKRAVEDTQGRGGREGGREEGRKGEGMAMSS